MAKLTLSNISNLQNEASVVATLASNNNATATALENTLSRDGTSPNMMGADLDMNSNSILNLPAPTTDTEPLRRADLPDILPAIIAQDTEPSTSNTEGSLWIDSDSTDNDLYQLDGGVWTDTGVNLRGAVGPGGSMTGPGSSVDGEIALYNGATGTVVKRASTTGVLKATSGVLAAAVSGTDYAPATSGSSVLKGNGSGGFSSAVAGTDYCGPTSGSSVLKGSSGNTTAATAGTDYMKPNTTSNLTAGFTVTSFSAGTKTTGTFTPDPTLGNIQHYTNGGAHTLAPPASPCTMIIECTNASAGALTTSGFTIVDGDTYSSTGTKKHIFYITKTNSFSHLNVRYVTGT